jgi:hypothetical protein
MAKDDLSEPIAMLREAERDGLLVPSPQPLVTLCELARRVNVSYLRCVRLLDRGDLIPDFVAGKLFLFYPTRIDELESRFLAQRKRAAR